MTTWTRLTSATDGEGHVIRITETRPDSGSRRGSRRGKDSGSRRGSRRGRDSGSRRGQDSSSRRGKRRKRRAQLRQREKKEESASPFQTTVAQWQVRDIALWSGTNKNRDVSTGQLARSLHVSLAPSAALTRLLACTLRSLPRSWDSE